MKHTFYTFVAWFLLAVFISSLCANVYFVIGKEVYKHDKTACDYRIQQATKNCQYKPNLY